MIRMSKMDAGGTEDAAVVSSIDWRAVRMQHILHVPPLALATRYQLVQAEDTTVLAVGMLCLWQTA